jgi:uncharacterized repeat protein (TIGR03803 family)
MQPALNEEFRAAPTLTTLYSFGLRGDDGRVPESRLIARGANLYGTTNAGGAGDCAAGCGTVFAIDPHDERIVYQFKGGRDGATPVAGLTGAPGALFGTTTSGGGSTHCVGGCGTVFKVTPDGKEHVIYRFKSTRGPVHLAAGLTPFDGAFYGTSQFGGAHAPECFSGCGTIFRLTSDGKPEMTVYRFKGGADGAEPIAGLIVVGGALFGTTEYGGEHTDRCAIGCGTVFRVSKDGAETVLHRFTYQRSTDEGAYPAAGLTMLDGALYGTTEGGGDQNGDGTAFRVSTSGRERVIYAFDRGKKTDGTAPEAAMTVVNGVLYGTTLRGGTGDDGTIFKMTRDGRETVLYRFTGSPQGAHPDAALIHLNGAFYGTTAGGGRLGEGTVFRLTL